jgi:hypothetical protein
VAQENAVFSSLDGVLFNKEQTTLVCFPAGKYGSYTVPATVTTLERRSFIQSNGLTEVTIPASVTYLGEDAFAYCLGLKDVYFMGGAPRIHDSAFTSVEAKVHYYPDSTWTEAVMQDYGGSLQWLALVTSGDFTDDGVVTEEDVIYLLWYTVDPNGHKLNQAADYTGDGFVTEEDVIHLLWHTVSPDTYPLT